MSFEYRVTLQIWHPTAEPEQIIGAIGMSPSRRWRVGDDRTTPRGTPLTGTYRETYCAFELGKGDDGRLAAFLADALAQLEHATESLVALRASGGRLGLLISWTPGAHGEVFDVALLAQLVRLGIDLGIEPVQ